MMSNAVRRISPPEEGEPSVSSQPANAQPTTKKRKRDPLVGTIVAGKYEIIDKLGEGGMGSVYRAKQAPIDRLVAVKVLLGKLAEDEVAVKRFEQEAKAVSKMQHPNTVTIFDYGKTDDGRLYLVMEFLKGRTLTDLLRADGPLSPAVTVHIVRQVCASLTGAHAAGIIHRDLKPDNIFLTDVGADRNFVKVLDFGVAKLADDKNAATLTQTGMIFGTPKYMSPEQAEGKPIDFRADIYAIGVVMFEMLTARPPFLADTAVALLLKHISEPPPEFKRIRPDLNIHPRLEAITMKALAKNPDDRFLMVSDLATELEACLFEISGSHSIPPMGVTGMGAIGSGPVPIPTEMVPGQSGQQSASGGTPLPPNAVPTGISLGMAPASGPSMPGAPATMGTAALGATQPGGRPSVGATAPHTAPMPAAALVEHGLGPATPASNTQPLGLGPAIDSVGGIAIDPSGPIRAPQKQGNALVYVGAAAVVLAGGILAFALTQSPGGTVSSAPLVESATPSTGGQPTPEPTKPEPTKPEPTKPEATAVAPKPPEPEARPEPVERTPRPTPTRPRPTETRPEPVKPEPAPVEDLKVTFRFESEPTGVLVVMDGAQIGRTPFTREFAKGIDLVSFVFQGDGLEAEKVVATLSADRTVRASLKATAAPAPKPVDPPPATTKPTKPTKTPKPGVPKELLEERVDDLKDL
jgi:serine/threonine protein kinase